MKRIFLAGVTFILLFTFCACGKLSSEQQSATELPVIEDNVQTEEKTELPQSSCTSEGPIEVSAELFGITEWAWAVTDWESEVPTDSMAAVAYSSPDVFENLTIAVGSGNIFSVSFAGEKDGIDDFQWPYYYARYHTITGPYWKTAEKVLSGDYGEEYILLPAGHKEGLLQLTHPGTVFNYPPADSQDIALMESQRDGRRVMNSRLLAEASDGGRISMLQFETTDHGLVVIAYIKDGKTITTEFTTDYVTDEGAFWTSESGPDDFLLVKVIMLYKSDAGLVVGFTTFGPEYQNRYLLGEKGGEFVEFFPGAFYHNMMGQGYYQDEGW